MTEETNTAEQQPGDELAKEGEARKALADRMRNHMHVVIGQSLSAAQRAHTGMCLVEHDHAAQPHMSGALATNLVIAEMARQAVEEFNK